MGNRQVSSLQTVSSGRASVTDRLAHEQPQVGISDELFDDKGGNSSPELTQIKQETNGNFRSPHHFHRKEGVLSSGRAQVAGKEVH